MQSRRSQARQTGASTRLPHTHFLDGPAVLPKGYLGLPEDCTPNTVPQVYRRARRPFELVQPAGWPWSPVPGPFSWVAD